MEYYEALTREKAFYTLIRKNLQDILLTKEDKVKKHVHNHTASLLPSRNTPVLFSTWESPAEILTILMVWHLRSTYMIHKYEQIAEYQQKGEETQRIPNDLKILNIICRKIREVITPTK